MSKPYYFILIVSFSFLHFSCKKEQPLPIVDSELTNLAGDYDWMYTEISDTDLTSNTELNDSYGLRITSDGYMILFVNGQFTSKHVIFDKGEDLNNNPYFMFLMEEDGSGRPIFFAGDSIVWITLSPIDWKKNFYYKQ